MSVRRLTVGSITATLVAAVLVFAPSPPAGAAPGDIDTTFGTGGVVPMAGTLVQDVAEGPGGTVTTGSSSYSGDMNTVAIKIQRFTAAGVIDTSFSGDGSIALTYSGYRSALSVDVDPQGRTVVIGLAQEGYRIWRFEPDGDPDPTFSTDGVTSFTAADSLEMIEGVAFQPDGDIVVLVSDNIIHPGYSTYPVLVRLNSAGTKVQQVDVLSDFTNNGASGSASLGMDSSGRPYVAIPDGGAISVRRYTEALALDSTYSGDGVASVRRPGGGADNAAYAAYGNGNGMAVTPAGVAYVTATTGTYVPGTAAGPSATIERGTIVARMTATGLPDPAFSGDGVTTLARPSGEFTPSSLALAGGSVVVGGGQWSNDAQATTGFLWQIRSDGTPETSFSGDGRADGLWDPVGLVSANGLRAYAERDVGAGTGLTAISLYKAPAATVPATPAKPVAAAGDGQVSVSWSAPADGGSAITGYVVTPYIGATAQTPKAVGASPTSTTVSGLANATAYTFKVAAKNAVGTGAQSVASDPATPSLAPGAAFVALQPCRVVDTRAVGGGGKLVSKEERSYRVGGYDGSTVSQGGAAGSCGVPDGAVAVEVSVTATVPDANGFFRVWPASSGMPNATFLNFTKGQGVTNTGTVALAPTGALDLRVKSFGGPVHYVIDVQGYFVPDGAAAAVSPSRSVSPGAVYVGVQPCRVVDTRATGGGGKLVSKEERSYRVGGYNGASVSQGGSAGSCGVPDGAVAVKASVTATTPDGDGYFRAWPAGSGMPNATFLNFTKSQGVTNTGTVALAPTGTLDLRVKNFGGPSNYVIDVQGYFIDQGSLPSGVSGASFVALQPCRVVDTRATGGGGKLSSQESRSYRFGGYNGASVSQGGATGSCGVPDGAAAVEASVTATTPDGGGYFRAWPAGSAMPNATFLNFTKDQGITNTGALSLAPTGAQDLTVKNFGGPSQYVIDVQGYYRTSTS